jgi:hypothetical protein
LSLYFLTAWVTLPGGHLLYRKRLFYNAFRLQKVIIVNAQLGPAFNGGQFTHTCGEIFVTDPAPDPVSFQDALVYAYERDVCGAVNRLHILSGSSFLSFDSQSEMQQCKPDPAVPQMIKNHSFKKLETFLTGQFRCICDDNGTWMKGGRKDARTCDPSGLEIGHTLI